MLRAEFQPQWQEQLPVRFVKQLFRIDQNTVVIPQNRPQHHPLSA
jgi:hypothetical protein